MNGNSSKISLGHGSGGLLTSELVAKLLSPFDGIRDTGMEDCAFLDFLGAAGGDIAVTMDGFTVQPINFAGGCIGELAICGSANDLAVRGAKPKYICLSVIAEEGLPEDELIKQMSAAAKICREQDIFLAAGDTKVVPAGQADKLYMSSCAIGVRSRCVKRLSAHLLREGDAIILTGNIGRHGAVIAAARYGIDARLQSDCAPLWPLLEPILSLEGLRCMRDCTRGGFGTVMCEWTTSAGLDIEIEEEKIPQDKNVTSICRLLGFDALYMACEGTAAIAVAKEDAQECLNKLKNHPLGRDAAIVGSVIKTERSSQKTQKALLKTSIGGTRVIEMPSGEILPRIC